MTKRRELTFWLLLVVGVGLAAFLASQFLSTYWARVVSRCGINVILAVSLNLVNGFTGQFSLGHAGFMAVGAYVAAALTTLIVPLVLSGWPTEPVMSIVFLIAILGGGLAAGFAGLLVGIPSLRLKGDYLAIVTLGFGEIIRICILNIEVIGGARGFIGIPQLTNLYWIFAFVAFAYLFIWRILQSIPGKQFMAVRDDETATLAMGLSTTKIKIRAFVIASIFAGMAGALFAHDDAYLNPATFDFNYSFQLVAMVVLGGMGSLSGSAVAAVLLTFSLEALRLVQDVVGFDLRMILYALILVLIMIIRPAGLFGRREISDFFRKTPRTDP